MSDIELTVEQKRRLVDILLKCPIMQSRQGRDDVISQLVPKIRHGIQRRDEAKADVTNLVERCLNFEEGLQRLLEALNFFEADSLPYQEVKRLVEAIGEMNKDKAPHTTSGSENKSALYNAKRALAILEQQAASYTSLTIPSHLKIELEDKRAEVARLGGEVYIGRTGISQDDGIDKRSEFVKENNALEESPKDSIKEQIQERRLDAAMPKESQAGRKTEVRVLIALPKSEGLRAFLPDYTVSSELIDKDDVNRAGFPIEFPHDPKTGKLLPGHVLVVLNAPDFILEQNSQQILIPVDEDSGVVIFFLTPKKSQEVGRVSVEVYADAKKNILLGSVGLTTNVKSQGEKLIEKIWQLVTSSMFSSQHSPMVVVSKNRENEVSVNDGAAVQGENNTAVGVGGVMVNGNVHGDVITGNKLETALEYSRNYLLLAIAIIGIVAVVAIVGIQAMAHSSSPTPTSTRLEQVINLTTQVTDTKSISTLVPTETSTPTPTQSPTLTSTTTPSNTPTNTSTPTNTLTPTSTPIIHMIADFEAGNPGWKIGKWASNQLATNIKPSADMGLSPGALWGAFNFGKNQTAYPRATYYFDFLSPDNWSSFDELRFEAYFVPTKMSQIKASISITTNDGKSCYYEHGNFQEVGTDWTSLIFVLHENNYKSCNTSDFSSPLLNDNQVVSLMIFFIPVPDNPEPDARFDGQVLLDNIRLIKIP